MKKVQPNTNPDAIPWPTDPWGFTRELRQAITRTAHRLSGDADKMLLLDETLELGLQFIKDKYQVDSAEKAKLLAEVNGVPKEPEPTKAPVIKAAVPKVEPEAELEETMFETDEVDPE